MSVLSLIPEDKKKDFMRKESLQSVYSSNSRLNLLNKRKRLNPLESDMSNQSLNSRGDKYVTQRVLSAKTHRVKQLQNQLADAHYHLQELSNENKVLRAMQKKQEIALQRYESSNAELPSVLNSHTEEIRIQQSKFKQVKKQYQEATQKLKERDMQLQQLRDEHQHLLELSKDRNLHEREKLQHQVTELTAKIQQQNETISTLQRRIVLEAKNFKHQLQMEINKHKDTRHDLDLAINNADKLSTIIEMKEKMLNNVAVRRGKSPTKSISTGNIGNNIGRDVNNRTAGRSKSGHDMNGCRSSGDESEDKQRKRQNEHMISKFCENSRNLSSALSQDDDTTSSSIIEPRSRFARSRTLSNSTRSTANQSRKNSKGSDEIIELAKTVQEGMADLSLFDEQMNYKSESPEDMQKRLEIMKADLLTKIKKNEDPLSRKSSALRKRSTTDSIEEKTDESDEVFERPKSRGRSSNVSFYEDVTIEETTLTTTKMTFNEKADETGDHEKPRREKSNLEKKISGKPIEKYCTDIIKDIEKSNKVIDKHVKEFSQSRFDNEKIMQSLEAVDKINEFVNSQTEIPETALTELNNNFKILTDQVIGDNQPVARKRSISGRRGSVTKSNAFGDASLSNQDLLNDLLGKK